AVLNTRPPATTGEPMPSPIAADQRTFFVAENVSGNAFLDREIPVQFGPRNWGQSSAAIRPLQVKSTTVTRTHGQPISIDRMGDSLNSKQTNAGMRLRGRC